MFDVSQLYRSVQVCPMEDGWFESVTTVCENFGAKMQAGSDVGCIDRG